MREARVGRLLGRVAVITGGSRGFGLAVARAFVREGARVVLASRSAETLQRVVEQLGGPETALGVRCDVAQREQVEALLEVALSTFGRLDIWVNNAGVSSPYGGTAHVPVADGERMIHTNILGVYYGAVAALRHFLGQGRGKLLNIAGRGTRGPVPMLNLYGASKAWVRSFTLALAREYRQSGVGVFLLNPGMMLTEMLLDTPVVAGFEGPLQGYGRILCLWAQPPEIPAERAVFLASSATDGRTGLEVRVMTPGFMLRQTVRNFWRCFVRRHLPTVQLRRVLPEFEAPR